jgi:prevent-host-death family protein
MTTLTAQEFNRDVSRAKRAAQSGPVFITHRGRAAFVLLTAADYRTRVASRTVFEALRPPSGGGKANSDGLELPPRDELPSAAGLD